MGAASSSHDPACPRPEPHWIHYGSINLEDELPAEALKVLSALRFVVLILAYIVFRLKHWLLVALMTTLSGAIVICKTFLYDWQGQLAVNSGVLAGVLLLVTSFVLPWGQAWFLDFRVVPSENRASQLLARIVNDAFPPVPSTLGRENVRSEDGGTTFYSPESGETSHGSLLWCCKASVFGASLLSCIETCVTFY
ncbi:hypothetical protein HPB51_014763 [Rhipicephalus microplus]|uniref:MENTAL domain-containing protein n=1 Tax=Rhipicephalus microplus TaxID=6941 RepID=A0A9J6DNX9_RHIMP|nr:hypothetical protein HPB51_014763 [Rhipicephalus microplus]